MIEPDPNVSKFAFWTAMVLIFYITYKTRYKYLMKKKKGIKIEDSIDKINAQVKEVKK